MFTVSMIKTNWILALKTTLIVVCLVISVNLGFSQTKKFSQQSFQSRNNSGLITFYLDSAQYLSSINPMRAIDNINKAIELSIDENDINNEALSYWILGNIQQNLDQHELACDNYKKCIQTIRPIKKSKTSKNTLDINESLRQTLFNAYKNISVSLLTLNKTSEAESNIESCFGYDFSNINSFDKLDAKRVQASILFKQGHTNEAFGILLNTLDQEKKIEHPEGEIKTLMTIGNQYLQLKNESKATDYYNQAKLLAEKNKKTAALLVEINNQLAQIYRQQKQADKEAELRNNNISMLSNTSKQSKEVYEQNNQIAQGYLNNKEVEKAIPFFEKSLYVQNLKSGEIIIPKDLFSKSNDLEAMANTYKLLAEQYLKMGDSEKALTFLETFVQIQDTIKAIRKKELDDALKLSTQIGKNQQRIELLEKERELSEKSLQILKQDKELREDELYTRNIIISTLAFLMAFMSIGVYYILKSSREKRRVNQLLAIKSLRGQMNPHFIFNALNSVNHYISQNDELAANKYLSDFSKLMRSVMETSKHDFISLNDELEILKLYLQLEHARFKDKFEYQFRVSEGIDTSEFEIPPMIIQPFIENAVWHGLRYKDEKGFLDIDFNTNKDSLVITIIDNGIGRKKSLEIKTKNQKLQNSTGMQNIENRILMMNEVFRTNINAVVSNAFENETDSGTKVVLFIPKKMNHHA